MKNLTAVAGVVIMCVILFQPAETAMTQTRNDKNKEMENRVLTKILEDKQRVLKLNLDSALKRPDIKKNQIIRVVEYINSNPDTVYFLLRKKTLIQRIRGSNRYDTTRLINHLK